VVEAAKNAEQLGAGTNTEKSSDPHGYRNRRWREIPNVEPLLEHAFIKSLCI